MQKPQKGPSDRGKSRPPASPYHPALVPFNRSLGSSCFSEQKEAVEEIPLDKETGSYLHGCFPRLPLVAKLPRESHTSHAVCMYPGPGKQMERGYGPGSLGSITDSTSRNTIDMKVLRDGDDQLCGTIMEAKQERAYLHLGLSSPGTSQSTKRPPEGAFLARHRPRH